MKIFYSKVLLTLVISLASISASFAQTLLTGFMQGKKGGYVTFSGNHEHYSSAFYYPEKIDEIPVFREISVNTFNILGTYGFTDRFEMLVNIPFVQTVGSPDAGVLEGLGYTNQQDGAQDISVYGKYQFAKVGKVAFQGAAGFSTPLSKYYIEPNFQSLLSIGNRATTYNGILLGHFKDERGFFITGQVGYSFRTTAVPDAVLSELKIGISRPRFYLSGQVGTQTSTSGTDILRPGFTGSFVETRVNYTKVGGTIYTPLDGNFGLSIGGGGIVGGRNVGQSYYGMAGLTYNFIYHPLVN